MSVDFKTVIELDEFDIRKIVASYLKEKKGLDVQESDVTINVGKTTLGYGTAEHEEVCFKGIRVELNRR